MTTYKIETDGWSQFSGIPSDPEGGLFGGPQPVGLSREAAERRLAELRTGGDWPDGRPEYWIEPEAEALPAQLPRLAPPAGERC
jgi:hypothetical protein